MWFNNLLMRCINLLMRYSNLLMRYNNLLLWYNNLLLWYILLLCCSLLLWYNLLWSLLWYNLMSFSLLWCRLLSISAHNLTCNIVLPSHSVINPNSLSVKDEFSLVHNLHTISHVTVDSNSLASMPSLEDITSIGNNS